MCFNGFKEPGLLGRGVGGGNKPHSVSINNKNRAGREKNRSSPLQTAAFGESAARHRLPRRERRSPEWQEMCRVMRFLSGAESSVEFSGLKI